MTQERPVYHFNRRAVLWLCDRLFPSESVMDSEYEALESLLKCFIVRSEECAGRAASCSLDLNSVPPMLWCTRVIAQELYQIVQARMYAKAMGKTADTYTDVFEPSTSDMTVYRDDTFMPEFLRVFHFQAIGITSWKSGLVIPHKAPAAPRAKRTRTHIPVAVQAESTPLKSTKREVTRRTPYPGEMQMDSLAMPPIISVVPAPTQRPMPMKEFERPGLPPPLQQRAPISTPVPRPAAVPTPSPSKTPAATPPKAPAPIPVPPRTPTSLALTLQFTGMTDRDLHQVVLSYLQCAQYPTKEQPRHLARWYNEHMHVLACVYPGLELPAAQNLSAPLDSGVMKQIEAWSFVGTNIISQFVRKRQIGH